MVVSRILSRVRQFVDGIGSPRWEGDLPKRIVILLTNPRSGSTWLFDTLRCHPAIYVHPSVAIYSALGLKGRRYPRDLSGGAMASLRVEVRPGHWEVIPDSAIDSGEKLASTEALQNPYAIEKIHSHFFDHQCRRFLNRMSQLEDRTDIRLIYQVRDPKASLVSFLRYQQRNPSWNAHREREDIPRHMRRIYDSILQIARVRPGLVVDYGSLVDNFSSVVASTFNYLWPGESSVSDENGAKLIDEIAAMTARTKRDPESTTFLGDRSGPVSGNDGAFERFFSTHASEVDRCYEAYRSLLQLDMKQYEGE